MIRADSESNTLRGTKERSYFLRVWKIPVPLRKGSIVSDLFKYLAFIMTTL
jgi:hypothetical protein